MKTVHGTAATIVCATAWVGSTLVARAVVIPVAPTDIAGKEYSNFLDRTASGAVVSNQTILWFGNGTAINGLNYTNATVTAGLEIDAIANSNDYLFNEVVSDQAALLVSIGSDSTFGRKPGSSIEERGRVMAEMPVTGEVFVWAATGDLSLNPAFVNDLDALEVGGTNAGADSDLFSYESDPGGIAVWDRSGGSPTPFIATAEIASLIGNPGLAVDVDALMVHGNRMLFSITASGPYDGGEIWYAERGGAVGSATFFTHGGFTYNTVSNVGFHLGCKKSRQNVDALAAVQTVPEPATVAALALGAGALIRRRRRA